MSRLEGNKPNTGLIIVAAIILALVAAGLFFAFRPVPEPPAEVSNVVQTTQTPEAGVTQNSASESSGDLAPIITPLPTATPTTTSTASPTSAMLPNAENAVSATPTAIEPSPTP